MRNAEAEHCFRCQNHRDVLVDGGLPVRDGGECRDGMLGNAETEHCFNCQNHGDVLVDGGLPVRDGEECRDGTLLQSPEPQRCTG